MLGFLPGLAHHDHVVGETDQISVSALGPLPVKPVE